MNFGKALELLKQGERVCRKGWNGKNMFIYLVRGTELDVREMLRNEADEHIPALEGAVVINGHIDMFTADESIVVGWLASQTDMLAEDWQIAE